MKKFKWKDKHPEIYYWFMLFSSCIAAIILGNLALLWIRWAFGIWANIKRN